MADRTKGNGYREDVYIVGGIHFVSVLDMYNPQTISYGRSQLLTGRCYVKYRAVKA
jgi:hypothetical protein